MIKAEDVLSDAHEHPIPVKGTKQVVSAYAERMGKALGYKPGAPLGPIVTELGGRIEFVDSFPFEEEIAGALVVSQDRTFTIFLPDYVSSAMRNRFTIAHELGHFFLHSKMGEKPIRVARETERSSLLEWQANWFAGSFLMPSELVRDLQAKKFTVAESAEFFRVSATAMTVRLKSLGLA